MEQKGSIKPDNRQPHPPREIVSHEETGAAEEAQPTPRQSWQEPTVLTLQDLMDLPRQILPEETYTHLRNAGREALLAIVSLATGINKARKDLQGTDPPHSKIRKHINVE